MPRFYDSARRPNGIKSPFYISMAVFSLLMNLLFTPNLWSHPANAAALPAPTAPSGLTATAVSGSQIDLSWTDNSSDETGFSIFRKIGAGGTYVKIASVGANVTAYANTGLSANTTYFYFVRAFNTSASGNSNEVNATTLSDTPAAPSVLTATAVSKNQINLAWTDNSNNEGGFKIERKTGAAGTYAQIATVDSNATTFSSAGLSPNTAYFYRVRAYNAGGNSDYSNDANATTLPNAPQAPGNLAATVASNSQIDLTWADSSNNETGFKIERKTGAAGTYALIDSVGANVTSYSSTGLNANTQYFYRVQAYNAGGPSGYSNEANATTPSNLPSAPSNLTATAVSQTQIDLTWQDNANNEGGFKIERKTAAAANYQQIAIVSANVTSYSSINLSANTQYYYRVRAYNASGHSAYSNVAGAKTPRQLPTPPSNLTATAMSSSQIDLSWQDNANNEGGFKIERKAPGGKYTQITTVGPNVTSYSDNGLNSNTQYSYIVRAYNSAGNSTYTNVATATTQPAGPTLPAAPSSLTATTISHTQINLAWSDNANNESGFRIERKTGAAGTYAQVDSVGPNVTSYSNINLFTSTQYFYRVRAYNAAGNSAYSNEANATTQANPQPSPSNLTATPISSTQINLAWTDNSNNETGFNIEAKIGAAGIYEEIDSVGANVTSYSVTGLDASTEYYFRVRAKSPTGPSAYSNEANATTLPEPPAAPGSLAATAVSKTQVNLTWGDNSNNEDGFKIERKTGAAGTFAQIGTVAANVTNYSDNTGSANTQYYYRVRAYNASGPSAYSNQANATTLPPAPDAPSNLTATPVSSSQINLTWTDNSTTEWGFTIEARIGAVGAFSEIDSVGPNVTSYSSVGLDGNTEYYYRVRAFNSDGNSPYSNEANATTLTNPPAAPTALQATAVSNSQINLTWTDNSNSEAGFKIERKLSSAAVFTQIATVGANVTSFANTGLPTSTAYTYRVRAYNAAGNSGYTNTAEDTTLVDPPAAASNLNVTLVTNGQIDLAWTDNATTETGFRIARKTGAAGTYAVIDSVGADVTVYSNTGLLGVTEYFYQVYAYNAGGNSAPSNEVNATTPLNTPGAPVNLTATPVSSDQINLAWADSADNEISFHLEFKIGVAGTYTEIDTVGANVTTYSHAGLTSGVQYFYRVRAFNAAGFSTYSNEVNLTTLPDPPTKPSVLTATAVNNTQIDLSWTDNSSNEDGFKIERKLSSAVTYTQIATVGANVTTYSNTGLTATTAYTYRVRAYNTGGHSSYSNTASATTTIDPPAAPGGLTATTVTNSRIDLAWTDNASTETGFKIDRKVGAAGTYAEVATVGANVITYADNGLTSNTQYFYRVRSYNAGGSAASNEANATTLPDPPAAPSTLTTATVSNTQIDLNWTDNANNEDGFKIERKVTSAVSYTQIATVGANVTSYSSMSLSPNTGYTYRVRAYNTGGNSAYTNTSSSSTLPNAPAAPSALTATTVNQTQINLAWTDNSANEVGFRIERKTGAEGTYAVIDSVGASVKTYANTGLTADTQYFYRVRAHNAGGPSGYSNEANATTLPIPPAAPSSLTATAASQTQVLLNWTDNAVNEAGFRIERKIGAASFAIIDSVGANVTSYSNTGLTALTGYTYRVRAHNTGGQSAYSNEAAVTTLPNVPTAPNGLAATTISQTQIDLNWNDTADNETGFKIERKTGAAGTYAVIDSVGANVETYSNTGLSANTQYYYRVRAYNTGGHTAYSNEANSTTLPNPPTAPSGLTATTISKNQINLSWTDNASNEVGFKIERKTGAAGTYAMIDSVGANVTSYANTGLTPNTKYFYRVRAHNTGGFSGYSNETNSTTLPNAPAAPSALVATAISQTQINLAWTDNSPNEGGFRIERKTGVAGIYSAIDSVGANINSYSNIGLTANTKYFYRVRAYNNGGNSAYSNEASNTTLPTAPSSLTATTASNSVINLAWTGNSNNTGFKIERKTGLAGTYTLIDSVGAALRAYANTGLSANTEYYYRIYAYNAGGASGYTNEANATTLPNAPQNLTATTASNVAINLAWTGDTNNDGFKIERKTGAAGTYAVIDSVGSSATGYADTGLNPATQYYYRIRAYSTAGHSAYSNEANASTLPNAPDAPSSLTATPVSTAQINLAWMDNANNEVGFHIERKTGAAGTYAVIDSVGANVTTYSNTGLTANTQYFYRVRGRNTGGFSAYSNEAGATTLPNAPQNLAATTVSNTQINLAWTPDTNNDGFKIERKTGAAGTYAVIDSVGANVANYSSTGLTANTEYYYRIRAYNTGGHSAYSNEANATTLPNAPDAPGSLTATTVSTAQIDLAWSDNANNEIGFHIERKTGAAGTYAVIDSVGANVTTYSNTGLTANTQYFYRVRGRNTGGFSAYSNEANATTLPNAPQNLAATTVSNVAINLAWTPDTNNDGFKIERKTGAAGTYAVIDSVGANVANYSDTGLNPATEYFYRIRAHNAGGHSAYSNEANATTLPNAPDAPGSLTATTVSNTQINLAWTDNAGNETGFMIERKTGAAGTYAVIDSVGANVTTYSSTGLSAVTEYYYRVRGRNTGGFSGYSNEANATTLPDPPVAPSSLTATTISQTQINLAWTDNADNEDMYKIERKTGAAGTYAVIDSVGANVTSYSNTGLTANTQYYYRVRAFNANGPSAYSNEANATTLPNPPDAPGSLTATTMSNTQINLAWTDNANNEVHFLIERKTGAAGTYAVIDSVGADVTTYSNTGLSPVTEYYYRVRARNTGGYSAYSNEANATTLPNAPGAPNGLTATTMSNTQINLAWTDNADNETGFKIERKTGAAGTYAVIDSVGPDVTTYANTGLSPVTEYYYRVRASNTGGFSGYSNEANATTLPDAPGAPAGLTATTISQTQINLAWTDNASNEVNFIIERKTGVAGTYAVIDSFGANVTTYASTGLTALTEYYYRVRAHNTGGFSAYSNEANATTLPNAPTAPSSLTATTISQTQINLAWTDNANNEVKFLIERKTGVAGTYAAIDSVAANVITYSSTGLTADTQYHYRVRAANTGGFSAYSNEANATTLPNAPKAPGNLTATAVSQTKINLAWADSSNNEVNFKIERKTGAGGTYAEIVSLGANVTSYSDSNRTANTQYYYRVRAANTGGNSAYSNEANATTLPNAPAAPSSLTATVAGGDQVSLAWTDNASTETGFMIERKISAGGTYAVIDSVAANVVSYNNTGLTTGVTYYYRVRARNTGGYSAYSNEANATPNSNANFALSKPTTASLTDSTSNPSLATDGSGTTFWRSGFVNSSNAIQWLRVELHPSLPITVSRVVIVWYQTYFANEYDIQVSNDGTNWTTVYTNNLSAGGTETATFTSVATKYVRLYCRKNNKSNYRVAEMEVYSSVSKATDATAAAELNIPETITLSQNYPNPFNPATTIAYSLPAGANVTLKVINIAGQVVATLVNGYQERGAYRVTFNARKLPSGMYYAVLQAGEVKQVKRMVLAK